MTYDEFLQHLEWLNMVGEKIGSITVGKEFVPKVIEFIDCQQAEIDRLEYILMGVMHSVDKWLDGEELNHDETNRAVIMREKTLQIVEKQQAEIERLKNIGDNKTKELLRHNTFIEELQEKLKTAKSEAIKDVLLTLEAEAVSSDKYIREYDDSEVQKAYNQALWKAYNLVKERAGDNDDNKK